MSADPERTIGFLIGRERCQVLGVDPDIDLDTHRLVAVPKDERHLIQFRNDGWTIVHPADAEEMARALANALADAELARADAELARADAEQGWDHVGLIVSTFDLGLGSVINRIDDARRDLEAREAR